MKDGKTEEQKRGFELEYQIDEPTEKVWRAISIPEFRKTGYREKPWLLRTQRP